MDGMYTKNRGNLLRLGAQLEIEQINYSVTQTDLSSLFTASTRSAEKFNQIPSYNSSTFVSSQAISVVTGPVGLQLWEG